jgi:hypothetical protein
MKERVLNPRGNPQISILYQKTSEDYKVDSLEEALIHAPKLLDFLNEWVGEQNVRVATRDKQEVRDFATPFGAPMFEVKYPILFDYEGREKQLGVYTRVYENTYGILMDQLYEGELPGVGKELHLSSKELELMKMELPFFP